MRKIVLAVAAVVGLAAAVPGASAQTLEFGPGGVRIRPDAPPPPYYERRRYDDFISRRDAVRIARSEGLVDVEEVFRDGARYRVEGVDRRGRDMRVVIDARSGDVIRVVRRSPY